ncbi:MAG: hypothetical protein J6X55_11775 [Victivallales bacterium]|nr:hypothetical protein [Victivallales bacterium]
MLAALQAALRLNPESNVLRSKWVDFYVAHPKYMEKAHRDYRPIYEAAPKNVDNVLCYAKLLRSAEKNAAVHHEEAKEVIRKCYEETGRVEGCLLNDRIILCDQAGRNQEIEKLIEEFRGNPGRKNTWAVDIAEAYYWMACISQANDTEDGKVKNPAFKEELKTWRERSLGLLDKLDIMACDGMGLFMACMIYEFYDEWSALNGLLMRLRGTEFQHLRWWVDFALKCADKLHQYDDLFKALDELEVGTDWPLPVLKNIVQAYLKKDEYRSKAIQVQRMIVRATRGNLEEGMYLAELLHYHGSNKEALALVEQIPTETMNLRSRLLRNRIFMANDKLEEAYRDMGIIAFENKMTATHSLSPVFYYQFSIVCLKLKKNDEALKYAKKTHDLNPDNPTYCNFYGYLLADFNRELDTAEKLIRKALKKEPNNIAYIDSLAWVFYRKRDIRGALKTMARLMELGGLDEDDPDGEISDHLQQIFSALKMQKMTEYFKKAKKTDSE